MAGVEGGEGTTRGQVPVPLGVAAAISDWGMPPLWIRKLRVDSY